VSKKKKREPSNHYLKSHHKNEVNDVKSVLTAITLGSPVWGAVYKCDDRLKHGSPQYHPPSSKKPPVPAITIKVVIIKVSKKSYTGFSLVSVTLYNGWKKK
jgi:hypothetical protein